MPRSSSSVWMASLLTGSPLTMTGFFKTGRRSVITRYCELPRELCE